ncbi:phage tail protein [Pseudoalteromonas piscicida]|uniref:phage tail protein n=1 Tax=Pseudoalteromonas piscicida TaxID=43662 RepID=UPI002739B41F|nr:phage tail protein [Pseudoalteromonas piscicida]MDP4488739.1 phage tail protein [Pseudoalteromonas piscicida]
MTNSHYWTRLTSAGRQAILDAIANDQTVEISEFGVGDGHLTPLQETLVQEKYRGAINSVKLLDTTNLAEIIGVLPVGVGGFYVREAAFYMPDGRPFALVKHPETYKPSGDENAAAELKIKAVIDVENNHSVAEKIDPSLTYATREWVGDAINPHGLGTQISHQSENFFDRTFEFWLGAGESKPFPDLPDTACDILIFGLTDGTVLSTNFVGRFTKYGSTWSANAIYGNANIYNHPSIDVVENMPIFENKHGANSYKFAFKCWIACQDRGNAKPFEFFANTYSTYNKPKPADISEKLDRFEQSFVDTNGVQDLKIRGKRALVGTPSNLEINYGTDWSSVYAYGDWNFNGDITITKNNPWLTLKSNTEGSVTDEQAAGISIGESGRTNAASLHLTYIGNGSAWIGMGNLRDDSIPGNWAMQMNHQQTWVRFRSEIHIGDDKTKLSKGDNHSLKAVTPYGFMEVGAQTSNHCHMKTSLPSFLLNKSLRVEGEIYAGSNYDKRVYHEGYKPSASDIGGGTFPDIVFSKQGSSFSGSLFPSHNAVGLHVYSDTKQQRVGSVGIYSSNGKEEHAHAYLALGETPWDGNKGIVVSPRGFKYCGHDVLHTGNTNVRDWNIVRSSGMEERWYKVASFFVSPSSNSFRWMIYLTGTKGHASNSDFLSGGAVIYLTKGNDTSANNLNASAFNTVPKEANRLIRDLKVTMDDPSGIDTWFTVWIKVDSWSGASALMSGIDCSDNYVKIYSNESQEAEPEGGFKKPIFTSIHSGNVDEYLVGERKKPLVSGVIPAHSNVHLKTSETFTLPPVAETPEDAVIVVSKRLGATPTIVVDGISSEVILMAKQGKVVTDTQIVYDLNQTLTFILNAEKNWEMQ